MLMSFLLPIIWWSNFPTGCSGGPIGLHPNMKSHVPDDGVLTDVIPLIAPSEAAQYRLLVSNPERLYWNA